MWLDSLQECKTQLDRINFSDFKMIMKGQPKDKHGKRQGSSLSGIFGLAVVPEGDKPIVDNSASFKGIEELAEDEYMNVRTLQKKKRSQSFEQNTSMWQDSESGLAARVLLLSEASKEAKSIDPSLTPLVANRALYRKHREMRISVLDASKQFDKKRDAIQNMGVAALIMKRGAKPPMELEDTHTRALFHEAHKRCGRSRRSKNKTVSDITGMLAKADALELS